MPALTVYDWLRDYLQNVAVQYQFLGVFLISLLGSASIAFPIPYTLVILFLGMNHIIDPLTLTVAGGLGSAIGQLSGYYIGYFGAKLVSLERRRKMEFLVKMFKKYGSILVFLFALTPLPDDLIIIPLGVLRYSFISVFIPLLMGKLLMCFLLAYFGNIFGTILLSMFGEENFWLGALFTTVLLIPTFIVLLKVDWEKIFENYMAKKAKQQ
ncbi:MAG: VTT domain-containing protein [Candidatus Bathyarchaeia archaeon]